MDGEPGIVDSTPHAVRRAKERYGVEISDAEWKLLHQRIKYRERGVAFIGSAKHGSEKWLVELHGRVMVAIYQPRDFVIVTIVPAEGNVIKKARAPRGKRAKQKGSQQRSFGIGGRKRRKVKTGRRPEAEPVDDDYDEGRDY